MELSLDGQLRAVHLGQRQEDGVLGLGSWQGERHVGENEEGKRESLFHVQTPDVLIMDVVVTSPRLPGPVRYTLQFTRERRADQGTAARGQRGE